MTSLESPSISIPKRRLATWHRTLIVVLSLGLYLVSFAAPFDGNCAGLGVFWVGMLFCWYVFYTLSWWANVLYWVALAYFFAKRWSAAAKWGLSAAALGGAFIFWDARAAEALAFQLWVGSMALLAVGAMWLAAREVGSRPQTAEE